MTFYFYFLWQTYCNGTSIAWTLLRLSWGRRIWDCKKLSPRKVITLSDVLIFFTAMRKFFSCWRGSQYKNFFSIESPGVSNPTTILFQHNCCLLYYRIIQFLHYHYRWHFWKRSCQFKALLLLTRENLEQPFSEHKNNNSKWHLAKLRNFCKFHCY